MGVGIQETMNVVRLVEVMVLQMEEVTLGRMVVEVTAAL
jgi:hypothetical protein